ncbi:MAG: HU family DNA-binding protein [Gemmataceae bacterium]|nr:HU family DNA-binding protein [Gemmataceae bacterium]
MSKAKSATKSSMFQDLSEKTGLSKKDISGVFDALTTFIHEQVGKKGPGVVTLPGLLKVKRVEKPATKARPGRNPATGETIMIAAKPKRTVVKALCLKALKEMVK